MTARRINRWLSAAALVMVATPAGAQGQFLCVANWSTALMWSEELQEWHAVSTEPRTVYLVQESAEGTAEQPIYGVWRAGDPTGFLTTRCAPIEDEVLRCSGGHFLLELTGAFGWSGWWEYRYAYSRPRIFTNPTDGSSIEIGTCTRLWG